MANNALGDHSFPTRSILAIGSAIAPELDRFVIRFLLPISFPLCRAGHKGLDVGSVDDDGLRQEKATYAGRVLPRLEAPPIVSAVAYWSHSVLVHW